MTSLSVNLNAVAYLRNRRPLPWPNMCHLARLALKAGAHGVTVHPRPDQRHTRPQDVHDLAALVATEFASAEFNIEGYPDRAFFDLVCRAQPDQITLVPDDPAQPTSDHGWNIPAQTDILAPCIAEFKAELPTARISLFIDANLAMPHHAAQLGADRIELFTGPYGCAAPSDLSKCLSQLRETADAAQSCGLGVNAGHDLTLDNLAALKAEIPALAEVSIGHALTADALIYGYPEAVRRYLAQLQSAS